MVRYVNVVSTGTVTIDSSESGNFFTDNINGVLGRVSVIEGSVTPGGSTGSYNLIINESGTAFGIYTNNNVSASTDVQLHSTGSDFLINSPVNVLLSNAGTGATIRIDFYVS